MIREQVYRKLCRQAHDLRAITRRLPLGCPKALSIKVDAQGRLFERYEREGQRYNLRGFVEIGVVRGGVDPNLTEPLECWHQAAEAQLSQLPYGFFRDERGSRNRQT